MLDVLQAPLEAFCFTSCNLVKLNVIIRSFSLG